MASIYLAGKIARDLNLELAGWRVHRFDGDLIRTNPAAVVAWAVQLAGLIR
jgi:very-short-patch-repair endonuclease